MKVVNKITGKDVTSEYLKFMSGEMSKEDFEEIAVHVPVNENYKTNTNGDR